MEKERAVWNCLMTLVIGKGANSEVLTAERSTTDRLIGLHLCFDDLLRQASTLEDKRGTALADVVLMGWADRVTGSGTPEDALRSTRLLDTSRHPQLGPAEPRKQQPPTK
jgi:hypothetical protein